MRIGLVVNILNEEYQISVFKGIRKRTEQLGIELLCLQDENYSFEQILFNGKNSNKSFFNLDGVIVLTSVLSDTISFKNKAEFNKLWGDIPAVSVGQRIEGMPSLLIQTDDSMATMVNHLVCDHKYKRFVYFSGPHTHYDARRREAIFIKTIEEYQSKDSNIKYIIRRGQFDERAAIEEIKECYEEYPDFNPDVIVCANDSMAIGVYKFFKINHSNPNIKECAVTGFDDIPKGRYVIPSLTTIHQPLEQIGESAVDSLVKLINSEQIPDEQFIESNVIFRNSCGCKNYQNPPDFVEKIQSDYINAEEHLMLVSFAGQDLNYGEDYAKIRNIADTTFDQLGINNFSILRFTDYKNKLVDEPIVDARVRPVYVRRSGKYYDSSAFAKEISLSNFYHDYLNLTDTNEKTLIFKFLNSGNEIIGCIFYDAKEIVLPYLVTIAIDISHTLSRIESSEERRKYSEYLEKEVTKRTLELVESNNKRMEVEAEVLKISELERQRFSTDLHDDICQRLAGISMLCRSYSKQEKPVEKDQMIELAELISETLQTTRQYAHNSYPVELESLGLNHSISNLCNSFEKQSGITCEYNWKLKDSDITDTRQKLNIFRIIQEALHNVMKHSGATNVVVMLKRSAKKVVVQVSDNGKGFNKYNLDSNGLGLNSMQYRANQIGATFEIKNNKPTGTCVEVKVSSC